jgi:8-oxo-dGTP pyrophosphatase MutT (NUDIX family)
MTWHQPTTWQQQAERVHRALHYTKPIPQDELLLPRGINGDLMRKMFPDPGVAPREAAVLLLFYPHTHDLCFPLTVRSSALPQHSGEVSLPGGRVDPEDDGPVCTALRETYEELGIPIQSVEVWGQLAPVYIPASNFRLTPIIGFTPATPHIVPNPGEIAEVFSASLTHLLNPTTVVVEEWVRYGHSMMVPFFALEGHKVWGATAILLSELVARLRRVA